MTALFPSVTPFYMVEAVVVIVGTAIITFVLKRKAMGSRTKHVY